MAKSSKISVFSPEGKKPGIRVLLFVLTLLALLAASVCLGLMSLYFSAGSFGTKMFSFYLSQPKLVALNTLPFIAVTLLFWFLSDRGWVGFLASGILCLAYSWAEYWTLLSRSEPIYAEELVKIREAAQMSTQYVHFTFRFWLSLGLVVLGTLVIRCFFRGRAGRKWLRILLLLAVLAGSWFTYQDTYMDKRLYNSFSVFPGLNIYMDNNRFVSRGGMYPFIYSTRNVRTVPPEGYSAQDAKALLRSYETDPIPEDRQVSVVCIMFEAFSDLSTYSEMIPEEAYADFHTLQAESFHGELTTNIFASNTINTERAVLTGSSVSFSYRRPAWSYARYFADNGYAVQGSHPGYASFYSRSAINASLGMPGYYFLENHYQAVSGGISPDSELLPEITRLAKEQMEAGTPVFSYNVTYQNHGPYSREEINRLEAREYMAKGDLDYASYCIVNNYLNGIADTGRRMLEMADAFRESPEPVILVFFGDHKPWMGDQGSVYPLLGINFEDGDDRSFFNRYNTEYLIWANGAAKQILGDNFTGLGPDVSPCFLMNVLFDRCGWEGPAWQKLTDQVMNRLPVVTVLDRFAENGVLVSEQELSEEGAALLQAMRYGQYYLAQESAGKLP